MIGLALRRRAKMFDKDLFIAGFKQGWRTTRISEKTIVMICYVTAGVTAFALVLHSRIN
jgi:hypothetical protein